MNTNLEFPKLSVRKLARTWIYTPVIATSFLVSVQPAFATIDNSAVATGTYNAAPVNSPTSNLVQIPVTAANPSLSVAKSVYAPFPAPAVSINLGADATITDAGDKIIYQYIITNNGNVTMSSVAPVDPGPKFGPSQIAGTGSFAGFVLISGTTTLLPGQAATFRNTYTLSTLDVDRAAGIAAGPTAVNNSSTATGSPPIGTYAGSPAGTNQTAIVAGPLLSVVKSFSLADTVATGHTAGNADAGELITYTYTVQNKGNVAITAVSINDTHEGTPLGAGLIIAETLVTDGPLAPGITSTDAPANNGTWSLLQPGATITFTYVHTVTQAEVNGG